MRKIIVLFIGLFIASSSFAQQRAMYSNFLMNDYYYNPAIAGTKDVHVANVAYRNQWVGFNDAPSLMMGNFYGSVKNKEKIGYGVSLLSENTGLTQNTGVYLNYAYHFKLSEKVKLGFGVKPGFMQYRVKLYDAIIADEVDDVLNGSVYSANAIDMSAGFNLYSKSFFLMGSIQHMLGKEIQFTTYNSNLSYHYNFIAGYNFKFKKKDIVIQPSFMMRYTQPVPLQYSAMLKGTFNSKFWVGFMFRDETGLSTGSSAGVSLGLNVNDRITVGYGYDYTISGLSNHQSGSHEIMLSFVITKNKPTLEEEDDELNNSIMEDMKKKMEEKEKNK